MTITKVKRTDNEKRNAANAANRKWRLKRRQRPEPIIVVIQNGEIQKKTTRKTDKIFNWAESRQREQNWLGE